MITSDPWKGTIAAIALLAITTTGLAQTVVNGSATDPVGNSQLVNLPGWIVCSEPANNSPDVCDMGSPSWNGGTTVTPSASPDGGSWIGLANGVDPVEQECAIGHMTGLTPGNMYQLRFYGACFGTGPGMYANGDPSIVTVSIGDTQTIITIPMAEEVWNPYTVDFSATAEEMDFVLQTFTGDGYASLDGFVVAESTVGINDLLDNGPGIHPNPANETIAITFSSKAGPIQMDVLDANGRTVLSLGTVNAAVGIGRSTVDIAALPAGIYHLRMLASDGKADVRRFLKL